MATPDSFDYDQQRHYLQELNDILSEMLRRRSHFDMFESNEPIATITEDHIQALIDEKDMQS